MLGTSGSSEERCDPVTARARILPPCTGRGCSMELNGALANRRWNGHILHWTGWHSIGLTYTYCMDIAHVPSAAASGKRRGVNMFGKPKLPRNLEAALEDCGPETIRTVLL